MNKKKPKNKKSLKKLNNEMKLEIKDNSFGYKLMRKIKYLRTEPQKKKNGKERWQLTIKKHLQKELA